jgi:CRP-like cAMP-binding protein
MTLAVVSETIRTAPLFSGLTAKDIDSLLSNGQLNPLPRGEMLFHQGDAITHFYLIARGTIQLHRAAADGHEKTLHIITVGQPFCESEVMNGYSHHRATASAINDVMVIKFPVRWLKETANHHHGLTRNMLAIISQQVHMAEVEAEHQASMSAAQLVACYFQWLCTLHNFNYQHFKLPYSKTLIASRLGMDLATFSRALAKLKKQHLSMAGARVEIRDIKRIGKYVCGECSFAENCPAHLTLKEKADRLVLQGS